MTSGRAIRRAARAGALVVLIGAGFACNHGGPPAPGLARSASASALPVLKTAGGASMVMIPAGTFEMGDRSGRPNEAPVREVTIAAFAMDVHEVTQADFAKYDLPNPSHFKGTNLPAEQVTWPEAAMFCNARSRAEGLEPCYNEDTAECNFAASGYRLPTEAEWEYACRAGSKTAYSFGAEAGQLGRYAWFKDNANKKTHEVGRKQPNAWGLFDMHGNVSEWCNDMYNEAYYEKSSSDNPTGPTEGKQYVLRGGSWASGPDALRSAYRMGEDSGFSDACLARDAIGFRCVRKAANSPPAK